MFRLHIDNVVYGMISALSYGNACVSRRKALTLCDNTQYYTEQPYVFRAIAPLGDTLLEHYFGTRISNQPYMASRLARPDCMAR